MKKFSKKDLVKLAGDLLAKGYKILYATEDGQFFTDRELAGANARKTGGEVMTFTSEALANEEKAPEAPNQDPAPGPEAETTQEPEAAQGKPNPVKKEIPTKKAVSKPKKK